MRRFLVVAAWLLVPFVAAAQDVAAASEVASLGEAMHQVASTADGQEASTAIRLVMLMTALSFLPGLLLVMTPFTRFVIVFSLLRQALGLQQSPPNQVLIGMSLALSMLVMQPTLGEVGDNAVYPYMDGEITTAEAYTAAMTPMRTFMLKNMHREELATSLKLARSVRPKSLEEIPSSVIVTAFVLSELKTAFTIAVKVYLPFLVVDVVVASVLLGMGMMMLPPVVISLPFKLMVFVIMDGWALLVTGMVQGITP